MTTTGSFTTTIQEEVAGEFDVVVDYEADVTTTVNYTGDPSSLSLMGREVEVHVGNILITSVTFAGEPDDELALNEETINELTRKARFEIQDKY